MKPASGEIDFHIPDCDEFRNGYEAYNREIRGTVYFEALSTISENWGNPAAIAKGIQLLLLSWHPRYSNVNLDRLAECINSNLQILNEFRERNILSLKDSDNEAVEKLYHHFHDALARRGDEKKSDTSAGKALGLLSTHFFPLWDNEIYYKYVRYRFYFDFMTKMKILAEHVKDYVPYPDDRSLLKRIDEYNYSKYTKGWI